MGLYNRTPAMAGVVDPATGRAVPFRCYNCNKVLIEHLVGSYELRLECPRCNTRITVVCPGSAPIPARPSRSDGKDSPAATPASSGRSS